MPSNPLFSEICEIVDCEHKNPPFEVSGHPYVRTSDIGRGRISFDNVKWISEDSYEKWTRRATPQPGDLILTRDPPIGNVGIVEDGMKVCLGQGTVLLRPNRSVIDSLFLTYLILGDEMQATFRALASGATLPHLNLADLRLIQLPWFPSIAIQRVVGAMLSLYDDLIETNRKRILVLEEMARAVYREWFVHFRFPGYECVEMVDSELGEIPAMWEVGELKNLADINRKSVRKKDAPSTINYVNISSVSAGRIEKMEELTFTEAPNRARRVVQHGDIIWSTVRPNRKSFSLVINPPLNMIASTGFAVITPRTAPFSYVYSAVTTEEFVAYLTGRATGSAYPAVSARDFENASFLIPTNETLQQFHSIVGPMYLFREDLMTQNKLLEELRDSMLPRLVSGRIDVSGIQLETTKANVQQTPKYEEQSTLDQWLDDGDEEDVERD